MTSLARRCLPGGWLAGVVVAAMACGEPVDRERTGAQGSAFGVDAEADDGGRGVVADGSRIEEAGDDAEFGGDDADSCAPMDTSPTMLGFGASAITFDDCDQAVRKVAAIPVDTGFYDAVVASTGLAACLAAEHCKAPAANGDVQSSNDPLDPTCQSILTANLPGHLRGELLPAVEIAQKTGCGSTATCVIPHGGMPGGNYAFAPVPPPMVSCGGDGGTADDQTTDAVLVANGYGSMMGGVFVPVAGLPSSVRELAAEIAQLVCEGMAQGNGGDSGIADAGGGGAPGCEQRSQYLAAYEAALAMGGSLIVDSYISNLIGGVLRASANATVSGVDCQKLGVAADFNVLALPVAKVENDGVSSDVATDTLARLYTNAYVVRIGMTGSSFPDLSPGPNGVPMSTFNGKVGAQVLSPYAAAQDLPTSCPALSADTSFTIPSGNAYSGVLGSPNFVEGILLGSFDFKVSGTVLSTVVFATDPCCRPPSLQ